MIKDLQVIMKKVMLKSDIAISSGGQTLCELAAVNDFR